ncbi:uncharacterized protein EpC_24120 [Erwinia pyrifoliae Ep1/96]|nr:uncharacterized protein EpC_24120 [Erwinia pyrifoliae Ep1/96]
MNNAIAGSSQARGGTSENVKTTQDKLNQDKPNISKKIVSAVSNCCLFPQQGTGRLGKSPLQESGMSESCKRAPLGKKTGIDKLLRSIDTKNIVDGLPWPSVNNGKPCGETIKNHELMLKGSILGLEDSTLDFLASLGVNNGDPWDEVIKKKRTDRQPVTPNLEKAVENLAKPDVKKGELCSSTSIPTSLEDLMNENMGLNHVKLNLESFRPRNYELFDKIIKMRPETENFEAILSEYIKYFCKVRFDIPDNFYNDADAFDMLNKLSISCDYDTRQLRDDSLDECRDRSIYIEDKLAPIMANFMKKLITDGQTVDTKDEFEKLCVEYDLHLDGMGRDIMYNLAYEYAIEYNEV